MGLIPNLLNYLYIFYQFLILVISFNYEDINLPKEHLRFYFNSFKEVGKQCLEDDNCHFKDEVKNPGCWGYENVCDEKHAYSIPVCLGHHKGWVKSKKEQIDTFYSQADFGYIRDQLKEMTVICEPLYREDSSLECSKYLRFCRGRNIMINFKHLLNRTDPIRYKMDVLEEGQIGGHCMLHEQRLLDECIHVSPLQSWAPELRHFRKTPNRLSAPGVCDIVIQKPTFLMKIDATVNMYHHFCDFLNLYMSQHMNASLPDGFTKDIHILIWESYQYKSNFGSAFEAFTDNVIWNLNTFRGKTVCFNNLVFPLLPRMIFGLYYNTPVIWGCEKSGIFHAFSKHILHRLKIPDIPRKTSKIHISLLSRNTEFRNILNEDELLENLRNNSNYHVRKVVYNRKMPFKKQLEITHNTDIFIGIHGAGLTHLLFLPDWAVVFELYNCEDENCYMDLARLRGIKYITWQNKSLFYQQDEGKHPDGGGAHAKFTNYSFDVYEFLRLVRIAEKHVKELRNLTVMNVNIDMHDEL